MRGGTVAGAGAQGRAELERLCVVMHCINQTEICCSWEPGQLAKGNAWAHLSGGRLWLEETRTQVEVYYLEILSKYKDKALKRGE